MSSIGSVSQLVTVIRAQLAGTAAGAPAKATPGGKSAPANNRYADENLAALIGLRVKQVARDDPQRGRKAFRIFLEAVLLAHFGEQMVNDPKFHQLLGEVQDAMEGDPACGPLVKTAIAHLLSQ